MKRLIAVLAVLSFVAFTKIALAAEDPTGTWKWASSVGDTPVELTLKLKLEGEKLTGVITLPDDKEWPIEDGQFRNNVVSFKVVRDANGKTLTRKFSGTVNGDTIKGTREANLDGQSDSRDWVAKRHK